MRAHTKTNETSGTLPNPSTGIADNAKVSTADVNEVRMVLFPMLQLDVVERQVRPDCRRQGTVVTKVVNSEQFPEAFTKHSKH